MNLNTSDKKFISFGKEAAMIVNWKLILDKLPEPFYTLAYFMLKIDLIAITLIFYVITSKAFGVALERVNLGLALIFGYLLFLDYLPYQLLKKKWGFISHYLWYKPLIFLPVGSLIVFFSAKSMGLDAYYLTALFLTTSIGHLVISSAGAPQGISLYPFRKYFVLRREKFGKVSLLKPKFLSQLEHDKIIMQAAENIRRYYQIKEPWDRTWRQELDSRKSRTDVWSILLFIVAVFLLLML